MFYIWSFKSSKGSASNRQMHCSSNNGTGRARQKTSSKERIAALRKVVEGLQAAPPRSWAAQDGASLKPRLGLERPTPGFGPEPVSKPGEAGDRGFPADLAWGVLTEVVAAYADRPAAFGFLVALATLSLDARTGPVVFVSSRRALAEQGVPYGHGLAQMGLDVGRLILVETETDRDALWAIEETLRSGARPAVVAGAVAGGFDLTSSRRLNLAAAPQRTPLAVLSGTRGDAQGRAQSIAKSSIKPAGPSAAAMRWRIAAAPSARDRFGAFAAPRWQVALERCRMGNGMSTWGRLMARPGPWLIEWNHVAHRFRVVEGLADRPPVAGAGLSLAG
jgi:protein ImuA